MSTTWHGTPHTQSCSARRARETGGSCSGMVDVSSPSLYVVLPAHACHQESRHVQQIQLKFSPMQLNYSPDGKTILYTTTSRMLGALNFGREGDETKDQWHVTSISDPASPGVCSLGSDTRRPFSDVMHATYRKQSLRRQPRSTMPETGSCSRSTPRATSASSAIQV